MINLILTLDTNRYTNRWTDRVPKYGKRVLTCDLRSVEPGNRECTDSVYLLLTRIFGF
jgi:hypothetical protein